MLASYRVIFATPGAKAFCAAGFVARMPISMVTLGIVLLVAGRTGSYGLAGAVAAAYTVATALSSPVLARLIDRWGQRLVLVPSVVGFAVGLVALVSAVEDGWPTPAPYLCAALAGVCFPPVGACVRARWARALGSGQQLHTAYSFEAVVDESIFIVGPVLVTMLSTQVHESAGLTAVVAFAVVGGLWLASQQSTQPAPRRTGDADAEHRKEPMGWSWLLALVLVSVCLGALFGSTEVVTVAFTHEHGHPRAAGALLATWALGSLIAGVITGATRWRASPLRRFQFGAAGMACAMLPLPFVDSLALLAAVLFLGGFAISPTLVACMSLVEAHVPPARLTEGITWVSTGIAIGVAPGAAIAGRIVDAHGASTAYLVPVAGGLLAAAIASLPAVGVAPRARLADEV